MPSDQYEYFYNFSNVFGYKLYARKKGNSFFNEITIGANTNPKEDFELNLYINKRRSVSEKGADLLTPISIDMACHLGWMMWHSCKSDFNTNKIQIKEF